MKYKIQLRTFLLLFSTLISFSFIEPYGKATIIIYTDSNNAEVFINGESKGKGKSVEVSLTKTKIAYQGVIKEEGYLNKYFTIYLAVTPAVKEIHTEKIKKITKFERKDTQKFVYIDDLNTKLDGNNVSAKVTRHISYIENDLSNLKNISGYSKNEGESASISGLSDDESRDMVSLLTHIALIKSGFVDTVHKTAKTAKNTVYISPKISEIKYTYGNDNKFGKTGYNYYWTSAVGKLEATIEWTVQDIFKKKLLKKSYTVTTNDFCANIDLDDFLEKDTWMKKEEKKPKEDKDKKTDIYEPDFSLDPSTKLQIFMYFNAIELSLKKFFSDPAVQKIIDLSNKTSTQNIKLNKAPKKTLSLEEAKKSTVTIAHDKGHGSGCIISKNGFVITNHHVVDTLKEVDIIFHDDKKVKGKVLRTNEFIDLAVIQIDTDSTFNLTYNLSEIADYKIGDEVFTIGTPTSLKLGQTLSKGIISNTKKKNGYEWIQTDASVSPGNSGGALVTKKGELIGIVNSKIVGIGIEGIAFCIPAKDALKSLNLTY